MDRISGGPSPDDAIIAIRVAQRDLFEAKKIRSGVKTPRLNDAEAALNLALSLLRRLERFLLGSVSTAVATRGQCSVEIVRSRQTT